MSWIDYTAAADIPTCFRFDVGTAVETFPIDWTYPDNNQYHYHYDYHTDPKVVELITEVIALLKEIVQSKKRKKKK